MVNGCTVLDRSTGVARVVLVLVLDDSRGARATAATTPTSALYWRANTNKPLQIACYQVSEDKDRSIGLAFVAWWAANKARAQSRSSDASAAAERRKTCAGQWRGIAGLVV